MGTRNDIPTNWDECFNLLIDKNADLIKGEKKICNNTTLRFDEESNSMKVRLHKTDVVEFHSDGTKSINSGGFLTTTTKDRINRCLGETGRVWAKNFEWFFGHGDSECKHVFTDRMRVGRKICASRPFVTDMAGMRVAS